MYSVSLTGYFIWKEGSRWIPCPNFGIITVGGEEIGTTEKYWRTKVGQRSSELPWKRRWIPKEKRRLHGGVLQFPFSRQKKKWFKIDLNLGYKKQRQIFFIAHLFPYFIFPSIIIISLGSSRNNFWWLLVFHLFSRCFFDQITFR